MTKATLKDTLTNMLNAVIPALTNDENFKIAINRVENRDAVFVCIQVPSSKVGLVLGRKDASGTNPTKMALLRIIRQAMFHFGLKELYLEITDLEPKQSEV